MQKRVTEHRKKGWEFGRIIAENTEQEQVTVKIKENVQRTIEKHWPKPESPRMNV